MKMEKAPTDRTEMFLRYLRRLQYVVLAGMIPMLFYGILTAWDNEARFERYQFALLILCPIILTLGVLWLQLSLKGNRYSLKDPDVKAIIKDEYRRLSFDRSLRVAFLVVMVVQIPLARLLSLRPSADSLYHMATFTFFIGFISLIAAFLVFERD
jgi:hypothetical protein